MVLTSRVLCTYTGSGVDETFDELVTEASGPEASDLDLRSTRELVGLMNHEDATVPAVVASAGDLIASAVDAIVERLADGGRLIYVGAGSSGRLAAVDAAECEATFGADPGQVVALVAGAGLSSALEQEAAEDDGEAGRRELLALGVSRQDAVVGISASGRTPYVLGAVEAATAADALTVGIVSTPDSVLGRSVQHVIQIVVGPELVAGSTRLKAGTAQKLVLNTISTVSMIRLGRTFGNLMVDVRATNEKLRARAQRIVQLATGSSAAEVERALADADGNAKVAIVSLLTGLDAEAARAQLADAHDNVRLALRQ
jgi:N-acetylmuramic acid 6-phosphate etherase